MHTVVLHVLQGPERGTRFELPPAEPQLIGRSTEALPLTDTTISRRHAELTPDGGTWYLRDLDSANGTFLNGKPLDGARRKLTFGDQIRCGNSLFLFTKRGADSATSSAVRLLGEEDLAVNFERTSDPVNADSMVMGTTDPARAASDHLRVIYALTALTAGTVDREQLLERIMDLVFAEFRPDRGFILLGDDPDAPLDAPVVRYEVKPKTTDEGRIPVSRTILRHAMTKHEGVLSTNAMNDDRFRSGDSVSAYGIRSALCAPIQARDRLFGVIHIDSQQANFTFTESQLDLLNAIARHAGLALLSNELITSHVQNARLAVMGETVASLSHSIKNILQGLRGGADAVEMAIDRDDLALAREGWPILARNLQRIYMLTTNMLTYSRPPQLEVEMVALRPLLDEIAELHRTAAERKGGAILVDVSDGLPPMPVDVNGLEQAMHNVVVNAVDALPAKRGMITIVAKHLPDAHLVEIAVTDNGPGIDPTEAERIFEAFHSTKGQRGTGLGLAVTRKIIEEHGGTIRVESAVGAGATVTISLPTEGSDIDPSDTHLPRPMAHDPLGDEF